MTHKANALHHHALRHVESGHYYRDRGGGRILGHNKAARYDTSLCGWVCLHVRLFLMATGPAAQQSGSALKREQKLLGTPGLHRSALALLERMPGNIRGVTPTHMCGPSLPCFNGHTLAPRHMLRFGRQTDISGLLGLRGQGD